jgi:hypothetical protein
MKEMNSCIIKGVLIDVTSRKLERHAADALTVLLDENLARISACSCIEEASDALNELAGFQEELCVIAFRWDMELPSRLRQFVREFDRSDDITLRANVFGKIKAGQFLIAGKSDKP